MSDSTPLLRLTDVSKDYQPRRGLLQSIGGRANNVVHAVKHVNLDLGPGEVLSLVGESGSGKSTLGRLISRLEPATSGRIEFGGANVTSISGGALKAYRRATQIIFQNPYESLDPRHIVRTAVGEPLDLHNIGNRSERVALVDAALASVGLRPPANFASRYPHELSGGQRQRVAIARAVILRPRLLVADEPVSMLDASIRSGVMNLLLDLRSELGLACVFITHDLAAGRYMSEQTAVMYRGEIVERGRVDEVIAKPAHPYTRALIDAASLRALSDRKTAVGNASAKTEMDALEQGCQFAPRCPIATARCTTEHPALRPVGPDRLARCHFAEALLVGPAPLPVQFTPQMSDH